MHLLIPFAAPLSEAGRQALGSLALPQLRAYHDMLRSFATFLHSRLFVAITQATEDAADMSAFHHGLITLHTDHQDDPCPPLLPGTPPNPPLTATPSPPS